MKTKKLFLCITALISYVLTYGQTTYVPDDAFEQALIDRGYDSGPLDDYVLTANINTVTTLNVSTKNISDLTGIEDFIALTNLYCYQNNLTSLNISNLNNLMILRCFSNNLTSLDISNNLNLEVLFCGNNDITSIDSSLNTTLKVLHVEQNLITSLNVSNNSALLHLDFGFNLISSIDTSNNTLLYRLVCRGNNLNTLDISNNLLLESILCESNNLTEMDLSNHTDLASVKASNNLFSSFNIKNGNNNNITTFTAHNNPNLECIQVDNGLAATNGTGNYSNWQKDATTNYSELCNGLYTYVPDDNFEQALIDFGYDSGLLDDYVLTANINTITALYVDIKNISDLTGIEDFIALISLSCYQNNLTTLDVSNLNNLRFLNCHQNYLTSLNISNNLNLKTIYCGWNEISSLETSLNTALEVLHVEHNLITSLNVSNNSALLTLDFEFNLLTSINISNNTLLNRLVCRNNNLNTLDISNNLLLESFLCENNNLTEMDLSNHTALTYVKASANLFSSFNIKNGNNSNITFFSAHNNPNLACIQVDDVVGTTNGTGNYASWYKSFTTIYSQFCGNGLTTYVPDDNFEQALIDFGYDSGPLNNYVLTANIENKPELHISNNNIYNLTGIEDFTDLVYLDCQNNAIFNLDLSNNLKLRTLYCNSNNLRSLNVKNGRNQILRTYNSRQNPNLTCIDVDSPTRARFKRGSYRNWRNDRFVTYSVNCGNSNRTASPTNKTIETPALDIKLYPNPTSNYITVSSIQNIENIELYDLLGKRILQTKTNKIDMRAFQNGIYIVKIYVGNQVITKKIIKE